MVFERYDWKRNKLRIGGGKSTQQRKYRVRGIKYTIEVLYWYGSGQIKEELRAILLIKKENQIAYPNHQ